MDIKTLGKWAFIIGLVLAIIVALVPDINEGVVWAMILLGVFAGWVHFGEGDATAFIVLTIGLALFSDSLFDFPTVGEFITDILFNVATFLGAAVIAVAVRKIVGWITD